MIAARSPDQWPYDWESEMQRRLYNARAINDNHRRQRVTKRYYAEWGKAVEWINDWVITVDPRNKAPVPKTMPFMLFPRQEEFIHFLEGCIRDGESGLCEKARDMGVSWLCCAFAVWLWLYEDGATIGFGSRKKELVDRKGDPKTIFQKIRDIIDNLPTWMRPDGYNPRLHATDMKIINPENGATITGEVGKSIGRGGRTTVYFKDESAHYEDPESIESSLGDNTDVQIDISSVNGSGNVFHRKRMAGEVWEPGKAMARGMTRVFIMDWRDHPAKTQEWYDTRHRKAEREGLLHLLAQEVDRDYSSALVGIIIRPEWVRACIDAHIKLEFTPSGEKVAAQDVADGGGDRNALATRHGVVLTHASHWGGEAGDAAAIAVPICNELGITDLQYDSIGVGSGFKTGLAAMQKARHPGALRISLTPWNAGAEVMDPESYIVDGDKETPTNDDFFENLKAQAWWRLRTRIYKTYRAIVHGEKYDPGELISFPSDIPNLHQLTMELSQPVRCYSKRGKTMVDKTPEGTPSPNMADAVVMCFNPIRAPVGALQALGRRR